MLGWSLTRKVVVNDVEGTQMQDTKLAHQIGLQTCESLTDLVRQSWSTESFGCKYQGKVSQSLEDRRAEQILHDEVFHNGTPWVAPILLRNRAEPFPASFHMARNRMLKLEKRSDSSEQRRESFAQLCYDRMNKILEDGHFRKLNETKGFFALPTLGTCQSFL